MSTAVLSNGGDIPPPLRPTEQLAAAMEKMERTSAEAERCCELLTKRARQLDALTSPASDASSMLSRANAALAATVVLLKDARDKFDTVDECAPAIERLHRGVADLEQLRVAAGGKSKTAPLKRTVLTEQDIYAAGDALEILRDAYEYFAQRSTWKSTPQTMHDLERVYQKGTNAMCLLIASHLKKAGPAHRPKRAAVKKDGAAAVTVPPTEETAQQTRQRLAGALQNRNLLKSIGEFEEYQPVEARPIREIRSLFDCLGSYGYFLDKQQRSGEPEGLSNIFGIPANKVLRTEKVGSGCYTNLVRLPLKTGFPQLDAYGEARKEISFNAFESFYRRVKVERKKRLEKLNAEANHDVDGVDEADIAARDAVRCLEHAMITVAGEKSVYKSIVSPALQQTVDVDDEEAASNLPMSPYFSKACAASYSYVVAAIVDRTLDIIETVFLKEGGIGQTSGTKAGDTGSALTVRVAAAAAAAGLRMLDGVRMLGPSLAKLCEMPVGDGKTNANSCLSATLCIAIHRTTVKNAARTLENLAKAIQEDPLKGPFHRPKDASVSSVSRDVVHAIRLISPYVSAYKSVSKRRALPWDPNMGEDAGELDSFVRHLVMRLLNSLKGKAINYTKDGRSDGQAKSNLFMMNNAFYLLDELGPNSILGMPSHDAEHYRIDGTWFVDKINKIMDSEKAKYLCTWEQLNTHLTAVASGDLEYQKNDSNVLSHESGRLIKQRFSGFNEDFETTYGLHLKLCIIDQRLRIQLQQDVSAVFLPRYRRFYEKYNKIKFSKKHQSEYTKYSPDKIEDMLLDLYVDPIDPSQLG